MTLLEPSPTAPPIGTVVLQGAIDAASAGRVEAELQGRIAVGTQVLVVDVLDARFLDDTGLCALAAAALTLQEARMGSLVLRNASGPLLGQLRLLRLDHMFELEI
ncbi:MAG: STAS domain-containing protein [Acidimicrobiales bacterium]